MKSETIYNLDPPDWREFSHFVVEHSEPLQSSEHPVIQKLIEGGWAVASTFTRFFVPYPIKAPTLGDCFVGNSRHEFEICVKDCCWLRFRFEGPETVWLTLFYVNYERQGEGLGKVWFPRLTDALFRAGIKKLKGVVSPTFYRTKWPMNVERLTRYYLRQGFETDGNRLIWKHSSYTGVGNTVAYSSNNQAIGMRRASEMATIS